MKNALLLACASIMSRPLASVLSALSVAAGITLLCALFLLSSAIRDGLARNAADIDLVVGAKGSPLQLVLSSIYQADIPTGNIEMEKMQSLARNPQVKSTIPLAMGDNYKGWRVIGTTPDYLELYKARISSGRIFAKSFEVTAGASTNLIIGQKFATAHGFSADSDDIHDAYLYEVVGILKPTGTVLDKLLLTPIESVQELHGHHDEHEGHDEDESPQEHEAGEALAHQVTAVLIQVRSPAAIMNLPRQINRDSSLQAASPSYEMTRLAHNLGLGQNLVLSLSAGIVALSTLMLFFSLAWGLSTRQYDLAVLRVLGASRASIFATIMFEGMLIGTTGALLGIITAHGLAFVAAANLTFLQGFVVPRMLLLPTMESLCFLLFGIVLGAGSALFPAISALRLDIANLLARGTR